MAEELVGEVTFWIGGIRPRTEKSQEFIPDYLSGCSPLRKRPQTATWCAQGFRHS